VTLKSKLTSLKIIETGTKW